MEIPTLDETIKRISGHRGVQGIIVVTQNGVPLRSTMDNTSTLLYVNGIKVLHSMALSLTRDIDPTNELEFMRIRSKKFEIMINCQRDFMAVVIQNPKET